MRNLLERTFVVLAAGGNPTGIICLPDNRLRSEYPIMAKDVMAQLPQVEQFGFLEGDKHFQMSGGEFCGNGARAAALVLSQRGGRREGVFTMSGFGFPISYKVAADNVVECLFPDFLAVIELRKVEVFGFWADLVDMGGIVHVVLPNDVQFNPDFSHYQALHREVVSLCGLNRRAAVGVIWRESKEDGSVLIHPVVWVRDIDSFFYETACGSGTLATLVVSGQKDLVVWQPSGKCVDAGIRERSTLSLRSSMEIQKRGD